MQVNPDLFDGKHAFRSVPFLLAEQSAQGPQLSGDATSQYMAGTSPAVQEHPSTAKVADWFYWSVNGALVAASVADAQTLVNCPNCTYIPQELHRPGVLYGVGLPVDVAVGYLGYSLKKKGHAWWAAPAIAFTVANAFLAYHWAANTN